MQEILVCVCVCEGALSLFSGSYFSSENRGLECDWLVVHEL